GISFATALHPEQPHCERVPFVTLILPADVVNRDAEGPSRTIGSPGLARMPTPALSKSPQGITSRVGGWGLNQAVVVNPDGYAPDGIWFLQGQSANFVTLGLHARAAARTFPRSRRRRRPPG